MVVSRYTTTTIGRAARSGQGAGAVDDLLHQRLSRPQPGRWRSGTSGLGKATKQFEDQLSSYLELDDQRVLMSTNSCTAALNCACMLAGAGPGDEVIAPSFTYVAAHQAITATGADVVFWALLT